MRILLSHVGFEPGASKRAVVGADEPTDLGTAAVREASSGEAMMTVEPGGWCTVENWGGHFATIDFDGLSEPGTYVVEVNGARSAPFEIGAHQRLAHSLSDISFYFRGQRHTGPMDAADRRASFVDREGTVDVHGGWCDASADWSKNLSHLNHSNYLNPQQAPLAVWAMLETIEQLAGNAHGSARFLRDRFTEEAGWGADFLARMQDGAGYFYEMAIHNRRTGRTEIRNHTYGWGDAEAEAGRYRAGFRQGGGMAIAALARAAAAGVGCELATQDYLLAAQRGFDHLRQHNAEYLNDGRENIIDDYCVLLAATELHAATEDEHYLETARQRAKALMDRVSEGFGYDGWLRSDEAGERPFFHAAEEGLPLVALMRYRQVEPDAARRQRVMETARRMAAFHVAITNEADNPFRYMRQLAKATDEPEPRARYFLPHRNETEYWWQGENGRIASLAAGLLAYRAGLNGEDPQRDELLTCAGAQLDWIFGANPFDTCMLHGQGRNNREYAVDAPNAPGGVYNGITADPDDESGIAFLSGPHGENPKYTWRWAEQWIVHASWLMLAAAMWDRAVEG